MKASPSLAPPSEVAALPPSRAPAHEVAVLPPGVVLNVDRGVAGGWCLAELPEQEWGDPMNGLACSACLSASTSVQQAAGTVAEPPGPTRPLGGERRCCMPLCIRGPAVQAPGPCGVLAPLLPLGLAATVADPLVGEPVASWGVAGDAQWAGTCALPPATDDAVVEAEEGTWFEQLDGAPVQAGTLPAPCQA